MGTYTSDEDVSFGGQLHEEMRTNDGELFQLLGPLGVTDERSLIQECGEGRTTNVAWLGTQGNVASYCVLGQQWTAVSDDRGMPMLRACSLQLMALIHPDKIFTTVPPPPPPWPAPTSLSSCPTSPSLQWKEQKKSGLGGKTLTRVLSNLQITLRSVHKRKISWPVEEFSKYVYLTITT